MVKKNAIIRYKILDSLLSNRNRYYSTLDLLEKVNEALVLDGMEPVSRRCIEKDLNALECAPYEAVIERVWRDHKRCIRYEEEGFSIFTKKLTEEEENVLSEVLNTIGKFDGIDTFESLESLKKRLDIKDHRRIIWFDSNPFLAKRSMIGHLFTAISNKQVLALKYHSFRNAETLDAIVYPYLLKEYNKRWFLIASKLDGSIRNFALDRIEGFKPMPGMEYVEQDEDLESRFDDIVGVTLRDDREVEDILVWVSDSSYQYVVTKPLHGSQRNVKGEEDAKLREKYPALQGGRFFKLQCIPNYELEQLMMYMMDQLVVLQPATLSDAIKDRVKRLNSLYSNI